MPTTSKKRDDFYHSPMWKRAQRAKRLQARGICEKCGKAGWEVHHIVPLTDENVDDPNVAIGMDNLMLLCTSCHNAMRAPSGGVRSDVSFDAQGNVIITSKHE